jgi:hypothetical protein
MYVVCVIFACSNLDFFSVGAQDLHGLLYLFKIHITNLGSLPANVVYLSLAG